MASQVYQPLIARQTSIWKLLPWPGLACLFLAVCCGFAALAIGLVSHGVAQNSWTLPTGVVQPSVLLSLSATLGNALLRVAFAEGAILVWWMQAQRGASVSTLYASYEHAHNFTSLFTLISKYSRVTGAAVTMILLLVVGPFLQRASSIQPILHRSVQNLTVPVSPWPLTPGSTARITTRGSMVPGIYTTEFAQVMRDYDAKLPISIPGMNQSGLAHLELIGPGWDVQCLNGSSSYRLLAGEYAMLDEPEKKGLPPKAQTMFNTTVQWIPDEPEYKMLIYTSYKSTPGLNGTLSWRSCLLREAIIRYPVQIDNGTVTLRSMPTTENRTEHLVGRRPEQGQSWSIGSTVGGLWLALSNQFQTSAIIRTTWNAGGNIMAANAVANKYLYYGTFENEYAWNAVWSDPTDSIVSAAHEMFLRTAISLSNGTFFGATDKQDSVNFPDLASVNRTLSQNVTATIVSTGPAYQTDLAWLISGVAVMMLACIAIAPMYWGWWRLERPLTMNPFETAKALDAPLLRDANHEVEPNAWPQDLKNMRIQYGYGVAANRRLGSESSPEGLKSRSIFVDVEVDGDVEGSEQDGNGDLESKEMQLLRFRKMV